LINDVSIFGHHKYSGSPDDHFFTVEMNAMRDGRNQLLNVPAIRSFVSQVAPVPFHPSFGLGELIDKNLATRARSYRTYRIFVNGKQIYKPYRDIVALSKGSSESVNKASFVELKGKSMILGFGWLGDLSLQGTVSASTDMDGLRLRYGNILIGNKDTLSGFFRERRFNNYLIGEIHVCGGGLLPNSRRDDFEESDAKDELFSAFIREVGIPLSRKIRYLSGERSKVKNTPGLTGLFENATRLIKYGYVSELQREHLVRSLDAVNGNGSPSEKKLAAELLRSVMKSHHILSTLDDRRNSTDDIINLSKKMLEIVYAETSSRVETERMIGKLYRMIAEQSGDPSF
jgi:molecular chaperone HtpG